MADLAGASEVGEAGHRLMQRYAATPMQEIKVNAVGAEPLQAALARGRDAGSRRIRRQNLADDENPVALAGDGLTDQFLGAAVTVHFGGIDERHAEIDAALEGGDGLRLVPAALAHHPRAEAERGNPLAAGQRHASHRCASGAAARRGRRSRAYSLALFFFSRFGLSAFSAFSAFSALSAFDALAGLASASASSSSALALAFAFFGLVSAAASA